MTNEFKLGIELGSKHFAKIAAMSDRWKKRNVPVYIRTSLLVSHYIVEVDGYFELFIIQFPITVSDKVHFIPFARSKVLDEKEGS